MNELITESDMKCPCCDKVILDKVFFVKLRSTRYLCDFPFVIHSGYRCEIHNREVGSKTINHILGKAADIRCLDSRDRFLMVKTLMEVGMLGIGIGKTFVHCDINRTLQSIWTY